MPNMFGGDQLSEDYAPHLYENGKFVGDSKKLSKQTKKRNKRIKDAGLENFDTSKDYRLDEERYISIDDHLIASLEDGFVKVCYELYDPQQIKLASTFADELEKHGAMYSEEPPRKAVVKKMEKRVKDLGALVRELKEE